MKAPFTLAILLATATLSATAQADLILGFDFQTGVPINNPGSVQQIYQANFGSGALYLDGSNGSSIWNPDSTLQDGFDHNGNPISNFNPAQLSSQSGTALNAGPGFATSTPNPSSLMLRRPLAETYNNAETNGLTAAFSFSMAGYSNLTISYAILRQNAAAFNGITWEYSDNGIDWHTFASHEYTSTNWEAFTLAPISGIDDAATAYVRFALSGARVNGSTGTSIRLDNIQFNAEAIPEPSTALLLLMAAGVLYHRKCHC